jgi:hypothetical protein
MQRFRGILSTTITLAFLIGLGAAPPTACTPASCAANAECAVMHCDCCGPNCPMAKASHKSESTGVKRPCPIAVTNKPPAIGNAQPLAAMTLTEIQLQAFLVAPWASRAITTHQAPDMPACTLLRLGCALTI